MYFKTSTNKTYTNIIATPTTFNNEFEQLKNSTKDISAKQLSKNILKYYSEISCAKSLLEPEATSSAQKLCQLISTAGLTKKSCLSFLKKKKTHAKFVHFGINIENVRFFAKSEPPEKCKADYTSDSDHDSLSILETSSSKINSVSDISFTEINGPVKVYTFNDNRVVFLDRVTFDSIDNIICGVIRVQNLDFAKQVFIKYSFDTWNNIYEKVADFTGAVSNTERNRNELDTFSFALEIPKTYISNLKTTGALNFEFCIRYRVKDEIICKVLDDSFIVEANHKNTGKHGLLLNAPKTLKFASSNSDSQLNMKNNILPIVNNKTKNMVIVKSASMPNLNRIGNASSISNLSNSISLSNSVEHTNKQILLRPISNQIHYPIPHKSPSMFEISPSSSPRFQRDTFSNIGLVSPMIIQPIFPEILMHTYDETLHNSSESHLGAFDFHALSSSPLNDNYSLIY
ncbi:hypothetical protein BB561_003698 [Smittium simulii]|uniref:CBM21 domain-containing protein n=1 Tax=Smittium simulii TaxID=133385 RepID=A0A2T9YJY8_9FUNG|nr:hypothetical protein BB561_003698 [Smittium simulii]